MSRIRIKELREAMRLSQDELSNKLSFARSSLSNWEISRSEPDFDTLQKIATFFNVSTDYLLGISDIKNPNLISENDFLVAFSNIEESLTEEQKKQMLDIANAYAMSNEAKKSNK